MDLLHSISVFLKYDFSNSQLNRDIYAPQRHVEAENDQTAICRGVAKLLVGEISIPMDVKEFPFDAEAFARREALQKLLTEWLEGRRAVKVDQQEVIEE